MQTTKDPLSNTSVADYVKLYTQESAKEIIKARIHGKIFRMADFEKIQSDPIGYACEIQRWKTAVKKALKEDSAGIGKRHLFAWGPEDEKADEKYSDLPENGVPSNKVELMALITNGRLGAKFMRDSTLAATNDDSTFNDAIDYLSGGMHKSLDDYLKKENLEATMKAMELVRLTLSAALNNEMELCFMKGQYMNYKAVMEWIDIQTECTVKTEYMADLFKGIDNALNGDGQVDSKCMEFRMAMEMLYIDKAVKFQDWEHSDPKAEIFEAEAYTPAISFIFLYEIYKQLGTELFAKVEEEFKREIGSENYNKEGWMSNKPKLFKIIKKLSKGRPKAKVASMLPSPDGNDNDSDNEITLEMDDGCILKVQPKFRGAGNTWKQNFSRKFNLQQSGNNKWQQRRQQNNRQQQQPSNQYRQSNQYNNQGNSNNRVEQQKRDSPSPDQMWKCPKCKNSGITKRFRGDQMCPTHSFRPRFFDGVPLAGIRELKPDQNTTNSSDDVAKNDNGHVQAIRTALYNDSE